MLLTKELALYLGRIAQAVAKGKYVQAPMVCPECGENSETVRNESNHIVIQQTDEADGEALDYVIIGCEGYWTVNPNDYGISSPNWSPAEL